MSLGAADLLITKSAIPSLNGRRSLYFQKNLNAGTVINQESVRSVRPSHGMHPKYLPQILGKQLLKDVKRGQRVEANLIRDFSDD